MMVFWTRRKSAAEDEVTATLKALKTLTVREGRVSISPHEVISQPGYLEERKKAARWVRAGQTDPLDVLRQRNGCDLSLQHELEVLLNGSGEEMGGFDGEEGLAEEMVKASFPGQPYCIVSKWLLIDVAVDDHYRKSLTAGGLLNRVLFAQEILWDSQGKRQRGDRVRSTFQRSFTQNYFFESVNTVYVLIGPGKLKRASGQAVLTLSR